MEGERWRESDSERETCWYIHHLLSLDVAAVHAFSPRAHMSGMLCGSSPMSTDIQFIHMILDCNSRRQQLIMNSFIKEQLANKFGAGMHPALLRPDGESMHHALSPTHAGGAGMHLAPPPPHNMQHTQHATRNTEHRTQNAGHTTQNTEHRKYTTHTQDTPVRETQYTTHNHEFDAKVPFLGRRQCFAHQ